MKKIIFLLLICASFIPDVFAQSDLNTVQKNFTFGDSLLSLVGAKSVQFAVIGVKDTTGTDSLRVDGLVKTTNGKIYTVDLDLRCSYNDSLYHSYISITGQKNRYVWYYVNMPAGVYGVNISRSNKINIITRMTQLIAILKQN